MTELAYMVREDWGQHGTAMVPQSAKIRGWLGDPPFLFATTDAKAYESGHSADQEFVSFVAPDMADRHVFKLAELGQLRRSGDTLDQAVVILHPHEERDCELLREVVEANTVARLFVVVWSPRDMAHSWLDGIGALDLHAGSPHPAPDPGLLEAAKCWVSEQYNGLSGGNGKSVVVQLLQVYTAAGYPLDVDVWLRAFFTAGGEFAEAEAVAKLIQEMQQGVRHRIKERFRPDILDVLRERASQSAGAQHGAPTS